MLAYTFYLFCEHQLRSVLVGSSKGTLSADSSKTEASIKPTLDYQIRVAECASAHLIDNDSFDRCISPSPPEVKKRNPAIDEKMRPGKWLIGVIEVLLALGLGFQISLTVYAMMMQHNPAVDRVAFYVSDWAINTPPILGVLANLVSFSLVLDGGASSILESFAGYFFAAVITTIIGGLFYMINLFLNIFIQPVLNSRLV